MHREEQDLPLRWLQRVGAWEPENADVTPEACSWFFRAASQYRLPLAFHTT